jgi:hypothetical protein
MVRVLAQNYYPHPIRRRQGQRTQWLWRENDGIVTQPLV